MRARRRPSDHGLKRGRAHAESRMRATCRIERTSGETTSPKGVVTTLWASVYEGKCRLTDFNAFPSTPVVGGAQITVNQPRVLVPVSSPEFLPGDRITILTDPDNHANVNKVLRVIVERVKSGEVQRHVIVDDFQSGVRLNAN